ncbi:MAG TPA: rod-binding protein [Terriglobales bacterium]|nr:rod-binding protein [Terriglobales bacterium]
MASISTLSGAIPLTPKKSDPEKFVRAAHQFEAVLLNQLLGSLEHAFASLGTEKTEAASDHYRFLGMQALASSIAAKGGIGIADMIVRNWYQRDDPAADRLAKQQKSLSNFSSERLHLNF